MRKVERMRKKLRSKVPGGMGKAMGTFQSSNAFWGGGNAAKYLDKLKEE